MSLLESFYTTKPFYYMYYTYGKMRGLFQPWISTEFNITKVTDNLFISDIATAFNKEELKNLGITHVLSTVLGLEPAFPDDFDYKNIYLRDIPDENIDKHFDECTDYIDKSIEAGGKVLVHCIKGVSRSATIIIAYLMNKKGLSFDEAFKIVKNERKCANPNKGYVNQLNKYDRLNKSCMF